MERNRILIELIPKIVILIAILVISISYMVGRASIRDYKIAYQETDKVLKEIKNAYIDTNDASTIHVIIKANKKSCEENLANILRGEKDSELAMPSSIEKTIIRR